MRKGEQQERTKRIGSVYITESLDFAAFLEIRGLEPTDDSPRPTRNKWGAAKNRNEFCFHDPDSRGEELLKEFQNGEIKAVFEKRHEYLRVLKTRREG